MEDNPNSANAPATTADLAEAVAATKGEFKELFNTQKEEMERLLADQSNVILEAVDERIDKKLNEKFDPVMTDSLSARRLGRTVLRQVPNRGKLLEAQLSATRGRTGSSAL
jgi:hypothetical protein